MPKEHKKNCASNKKGDHYEINPSIEIEYSCDCGQPEVKAEGKVDNEVRLPNYEHTTHFACKERMNKFGGKTIGCCCNAHICKSEVSSLSPESWEIASLRPQEIYQKIDFLMDALLECGRVDGESEKHKYRLISSIEELLSSEKAKAKERWKREVLAELPDKLQGLDYAQGYNAALEQAKELIENS